MSQTKSVEEAALTEAAALGYTPENLFFMPFLNGIDFGVSWWTLREHPDVKALLAAAKQLSSFVDQLTVMDGSLRDPISDAMNELEEVLIRFEKGQADE